MDVEQLLAAYSCISSANKSKFSKLRVVLHNFHASGIDCLLLKGADLLPRVYGVMGLRSMVDVDLLVHDEDLPAVDAILRTLGYRPQIDGNPAYVCADGILVLDLITAVWYLDDQEVIWRRAVQRDIAGIPVKGMGASDLLVYLTAYNVVHRGYLAPSFARDIALLLEKERVDWEFVLNETRRQYLRVPLYHGLRYVVRHGPASIPDHVLRDLAPTGHAETLLHSLLQRVVTPQPVADVGHLLLFLTLPGRKKWRWVGNALFPSEAFLKCRYGEQWDRKPLRTRLGRPFHLLSQALRLSARLATVLLGGRMGRQRRSDLPTRIASRHRARGG